MTRVPFHSARVWWVVALAALSSITPGRDAVSSALDVAGKANGFEASETLCYVARAGVDTVETQYLAQNDAAMRKMMTDMAVSPLGDVDHDFVAMMVPHHQGAIDMAVAVLRYGRNEKIRRLAQEIIVTQQQEIVAMRLAVGDALTPSIASSTEHL